MKLTMLSLVLLLLCISQAKADSAPADQIGPTWEVTAAGIFSGGGASESFALDWTVSFVTFDGENVFPEFSGTTLMTGVLGTVTEVMQDRMLASADGGYLAFDGPAAQAEIDIPVHNYYPYGPTPLTLSYVTANPPVIQSPYLYSCEVASVCQAFGSQVGIGLFCCTGPIVESVREVPAATPEPGVLTLLMGSAIIIGVKRRIVCRLRQSANGTRGPVPLLYIPSFVPNHRQNRL